MDKCQICRKKFLLEALWQHFEVIACAECHGIEKEPSPEFYKAFYEENRVKLLQYES